VELSKDEKCAEFAGEVEDILAYHRFVGRIWGNATALSSGASELLVAFHNMVTMSVRPAWFSTGRRDIYCYSQVRGHLSARPGGDDAGPELDSAPAMWAKAENLLGFADRSERSC